MAWLPFELFLALRYLRPKRTFVSVITLICIIGVMLGVAVLIVVISVMTGFDRQLRDKIIGFNAHIRVMGEHPFEDYRALMGLVSRHEGVRGVAPFAMGLAIIETQTAEASAQFWTPMIRGVDPESEKTVSVLQQSVKAGAFDLRGNGLVIGRSLAERLGLNVGDSLAVSSAKHLHKLRSTRRAQHEEMPLPDDYEVRGIFDVGHFEYNSGYMLCSLANAQDLFDLGDGVQGLIVMLDDPERATEVAHGIQAHLGGGFTVTTWKEENAGILDALIVEKNVMFYLLFFITIVAAFGIASALITFVVQKTREIGLLKAIGATRVQVMALFLTQSLVVGVVGVIAGFGLGLLAVGYRNEFLGFMRRTTGWSLFPPEIYNFNELPALVVPGDVALICGGSLVICLLAGLIPAWNAGRLLPVEALRHE